MKPRLFLLIALLPGLGECRAAEGWAKLRLGMTATQAALTLGEPLVRTAGQGFELWIYDRHAEVVFYGPLVGWTSPGTDARPGTAVDVWQTATAQSEGGHFFLPRPAGRPPALRPDSPPSDGYLLPSYRRR